MVCQESINYSRRCGWITAPRLTSNDWKAVEYVPGPIDDIFIDTHGGPFDFSSYLESDDSLTDVDSNYGPELIAEDFTFDHTLGSIEEFHSVTKRDNLDYVHQTLEQSLIPEPISILVPMPSKIKLEPKICKGGQDINTIANQKIKHQCTERDVLFGRGGARNHHAGNRRYRQLVSDNKQQYRQSACKDEKTKIAKSIVDAVNKYDGRFLMQDALTGDWIEVEKRKARQKVSQALRD
mmetsp:Transcript_3737/g.3519  ORF Transcript_3737/g.3519 Transcript_3737/m.3519 type:complete len:237 (-) Transcript_3737:28-738(-)|eukprot:CAMPEP_0197834826 /NCGR_PEP_ID=MMETSP1437-20131217/23844_1 /TAXON_ID=49252 ORGANISM="Eucampia antarctica, Strain CCMP1452" /NCGR_SAMPLE_ID=MMETSP1437 /ASSEMBLY_ACC=CAM_ASM_001096 /LENGTH=236 /DNA_ID=CAMNT_0043439819 /DNA_START=46 /DNA_END=756 /DNA_ORIENTATION=+